MTTRLLGRYRLGDILGAGAFATVHHGHDEQLDAPVAIKLLAHNHAVDPEMRGRFVSEGQVLRRIASPHVVGVHDLAEAEDGRPFLVLELCDRGTLRERVDLARASGWTPAPADVVALARPLAVAIDAINEANAVHRDLTPSNILLSAGPRSEDAAAHTTLLAPDERLVVTDLGFCKDLVRSTGVTAAGGTDGFQPPEQRQSGGTVDVRSDLWAASAVLTWALAGAVVGDRDDARDALLVAGLGPDLARAISRGLADDPEARPSTPAEWLEDIVAATPGTHASGPVPAPRQLGYPFVAGTGRSTGTEPSSRKVAITVLGLVVLLVGFVLTRGGPDLSAQADRPWGEDAFPAATDSAAEATIPPEELAYGYGPTLEGEWDFHITTHEGWEYDVDVAAEAAVALRTHWEDTSPPGEGWVQSAVIGGATVTSTPTIVGREAPELVVQGVMVTFVGDQELAEDAGFCWSGDQLIGSAPTFQFACSVDEGGFRTEARWVSFAHSGTKDLQLAEAQVAEYQGAPPQFFLLKFRSTPCVLALLPDGRVGRAEPFFRADKPLTCEISGPNTFTYEEG